jgi:hypothetical protein
VQCPEHRHAEKLEVETRAHNPFNGSFSSKGHEPRLNHAAGHWQREDRNLQTSITNLKSGYEQSGGKGRVSWKCVDHLVDGARFMVHATKTRLYVRTNQEYTGRLSFVAAARHAFIHLVA